MRHRRDSAQLFLAVLFTWVLTGAVFGQIPPPKDVLGFTPGDDRKLASWAAVIEYFQKLDAASDRVQLQEIGKSTMGAPFVYATISSPQNLKNLEFYKAINDKLADPRKIISTRVQTSKSALAPLKAGSVGGNLSQRADAAALRLIEEGKTIVLITCGIHSTEVGSYLSSMLIAYRLAIANDPETKKILDNTIVLLVPSLNPDGVDIVKNWYDKTLGTQWEGTDPPELYHKYVGHDLNRDWYAFTQVETQLTVEKIQNFWHPQIVLDIHQQGVYGARQFLPPYMPPVEPNVPQQIVEGFTELGTFIAEDLRKQGFAGITTGTTYDAWTPARAYSHYHGGVRILSETASARLATPVEIKFEKLGTSPGGLDAKKETPNFSPVWRGGEWKLRNITDYMTATAFSLLGHAANNRKRWLSRFYEIGKQAVRPRRSGEPVAYIVKDNGNTSLLKGILSRAGVEYEIRLRSTTPDDTHRILIIKTNQPYFGFAKAILETQTYPDLKDADGNPIAPYDVTAHTLSLMHDFEFESVTRLPRLRNAIRSDHFGSGSCSGRPVAYVSVYRSHIPSIDAGWTRFVLTDKQWREVTNDCSNLNVQILGNDEIRRNSFAARTIIFPDQPANQILDGYAKGSLPDQYTGGVGKEGVENLKKFVENGGTLIFLNRSSNFAIEHFNLPVKDVTRGLARKDFYIPGSILRTELDTSHPFAKEMPQESIVWFEDSPAFEVHIESSATETGESTVWQTIKPQNIRILARYPNNPQRILLSGWALGAENIAGKSALLEVRVGKGKIVLFGFRPQYRGQSLATFPLLFNAISP
ncbi:MAG: hypothetical protein C4324_12190 [Blastocatellia bacterium]